MSAESLRRATAAVNRLYLRSEVSPPRGWARKVATAALEAGRPRLADWLSAEEVGRVASAAADCEMDPGEWLHAVVVGALALHEEDGPPESAAEYEARLAAGLEELRSGIGGVPAVTPPPDALRGAGGIVGGAPGQPVSPSSSPRRHDPRTCTRGPRCTLCRPRFGGR